MQVIQNNLLINNSTIKNMCYKNQCLCIADHQLTYESIVNKFHHHCFRIKNSQKLAEYFCQFSMPTLLDGSISVSLK